MNLAPKVTELLILVLFVLATSQPLKAQVEFPYHSREINMEDGLFYHEVLAWIRHSNGFDYYFGRHGVHRYDGYEFRFHPYPDGAEIWRFSRVIEFPDGQIHLYEKFLRDTTYFVFDTESGQFAQHSIAHWNPGAHTFLVDVIRHDLLRVLALEGGTKTVVLEIRSGVLFSRREIHDAELYDWVLDYSQRFFYRQSFSQPLITEEHLFLEGTSRLGKAYNYQNARFENVLPPADEQFFYSRDVDGKAWVFLEDSKGGACFFPLSEPNRKQILPEATYDDLLGICADGRGNLLLIHHSQEKESYVYEHGALYPFIGPNRPIFVYASEISKRIMLSNNEGIRLYERKPLAIKSFLTNHERGKPSGARMRSLCETADGRILAVEEFKKIHAWMPSTAHTAPSKGLSDFKADRSPDSRYVHTMKQYSQNQIWWIEEDARGEKFNLVCYGDEGESLEEYPVYITQLNHFTIDEADQKIWLAGQRESNYLLYEFDLLERRIVDSVFLDLPTAYESLSTIEYMLVDSYKTLWVATRVGLYKYDLRRKSWALVPLLDQDGEEMGKLSLITLFEDSQKRLWIGTFGHGLLLFDPQKELVLKTYNTSNGLSNDKVATILEDDAGRIWLGTYHGISCLDAEEGWIRSFFKTNGLSDNECNRRSALKKSDGTLFFGGQNGVNYFNPDALLREWEVSNPRLLVSRIAWYDASGNSNDLEHWEGQALKLPANQRSLEVQVALADERWLRQGKKYAYRIEGLNNHWELMGENRILRLASLPSGNYTLRIRGAYLSENWSSNEIAIPIEVAWPFYAQSWFILILILLLGAIVYGFYRFWLNKHLVQQALQHETFRTRLYENIAHEFRTPLTVIQGVSSDMERGQMPRPVNQLGAIIRKNANRILSLINQLLDLQKLDAGSYKPDYQWGDVVVFLRELCDNFGSLMAKEGLSCRLELPPVPIFIEYDPDILSKIVGNLLSNAIKFSPTGGEIVLKLQFSDNVYEISVSDNGPGIPRKDHERIFDRFFQSQHTMQTGVGTGIGLAITRELTQLLDGEIALRSEPDNGASFTIKLPLRSIAHNTDAHKPVLTDTKIPHAIAGSTTSGAPALLSSGEMPLLLIVEDSPDICQMLEFTLSENYHCVFVDNGLKGLERARTLVPDVILSDVMMPVMDGLEFLQNIRADIRTSHIPVILLTARTQASDRLTGLRFGANAYLAKPFQPDELRLSIRNMLKLRDDLKTINRAQQPLLEIEAAFDVNKEQNFLEVLYNYIEENFKNPDFTTNELCLLLNISASQLQRKLNALKGKTALQLIREARLQWACQLLEHTDQSISEVAYNAGFSDPAYFSRVFSKAYSVSPSGFRESLSSK